MLFNSLEFAVFFPLITFIYFMCPYKYRWGVLLAASCIFYMAFVPKYILLLGATIIVDYYAGIWIEKTHGRQRKIIFWADIAFSLGILFIFKYFNFFNHNIEALARLIHWNYSVEGLKLILPIGISFYTFQSLSYIIEVYKGKQKAEKHLGRYAVYVMFYPQLVAGPIERPGNLLSQLHCRFDFDYVRVTDGLKIMTWGLFKKAVIADRLAIYVDQVYSNPMNYEGISLTIATVFFAFQIYCDFSGYSDIAIGAAQVMGIRLMDNFNRPYFSKSVAEFWKRWHISLMSWFRDYVYIPLGGNRVSHGRWVLNITIIFLISGLWHGASWTFIIWGLINGFYILFGRWTKKYREVVVHASGISKYPRIHKLFQVFITFFLVCFSWIFFRAQSIQDAFYIVRHIFSETGYFIINILLNLDQLGGGRDVLRPIFLELSRQEFLIAVLSILCLEIFHFIQRHNSIRHMLREKPAWLRWSVYYFLFFSIFVFGVFENQKPFIYFQF